MVGLILGILYAALLLVFGGSVLGEVKESAIFVSATHFMFIWYITWTVVLGIFPVGLMLFGGLAGAGAGIDAGGYNKKHQTILGLAGFAGGTALAAIPMFFYLIRRGLYIFGAYLLYTAGTATMSLSNFNKTNLYLGGMMFCLILILKLKVKNSTFNNSSK